MTVSQPQATGRASFVLPCDDLLRPVRVTVHSNGAPFTLGQAQASASVTVKRGKIQQAQDLERLDVQPSVLVELAATALLQNGGQAVLIDVTVACPVGATGLDSSDVGIGQEQPGGLAAGRTNYVPELRRAAAYAHDPSCRVTGALPGGNALATTFAAVEAGGNPFLGVDQKTIQIVT